VASPDDMTSQETDICLLDLQNQLAQKILAILEVEVEEEKLRDLERVPTNSCDALRANNQAAELVMQGGFHTAETLLTRALTLDPRYADAHNNLGQLLYRQGDWAGAITRYQEAIALQPAIPIYHYNLGLARERAGEYVGAVAAYQTALTLDPVYVQALNNLAFTYLQMGQLAEALTTVQQGLELDPHAPYLHKNLGRIYLEQGQPEQAAGELEQALSLFADGVYAEALYYLALAYAGQSQTESACVALDRLRRCRRLRRTAARRSCARVTARLGLQVKKMEIVVICHCE
jgi:Flp pilus assembly protein TadD